MKKTKGMCELCGAEPANAFSAIPVAGAKFEWKLTCNCPGNREVYYIEFKQFFASRYSMKIWLRQLNGKSWMNWKSFMDALERYMESKE